MLKKLRAESNDLSQKIEASKKELVEVSDAVQLQDFGLYTPHYNLMRADEYKAKMMEIRALQKDMVRNGSAVTGSQTWTVNGNASKGNEALANMRRQARRRKSSYCV